MQFVPPVISTTRTIYPNKLLIIKDKHCTIHAIVSRTVHSLLYRSVHPTLSRSVHAVWSITIHATLSSTVHALDSRPVQAVLSITVCSFLSRSNHPKLSSTINLSMLHCQVLLRLLAVETEGAASLHRSLEKREVGMCQYTATTLHSTLSYLFVLYLFVLYHGLIYCIILEGTARYAGLHLAPADDFGLWRAKK